MQLIALYQIASGKKGARKIITPGMQFNTEDYPDISQKEWDTMMKGSPQIVRTLDDPAFKPATVVKPRDSGGLPSARLRPIRAEDMGDDLPPKEAVAGAEDDDDDDDPPPKKAAEDDDDDDDDPPPKAKGKRGRRRKTVEDDDDI
jgi:hypothetical protein